MRIHFSSDHAVTPNADAQPASAGRAADPAPDAPASGPSHRDLLRLFHGERDVPARTVVTSPLPAARRRAVRERMLDGTYSAPAVLHEVARQVLTSGDLAGS